MKQPFKHRRTLKSTNDVKLSIDIDNGLLNGIDELRERGREKKKLRIFQQMKAIVSITIVHSIDPLIFMFTSIVEYFLNDESSYL